MPGQRILYLNWKDLESLEVGSEALFKVISSALAAKAGGGATMPPMTFFAREPKQWYHLTMSWIPSLTYAAAKFQSGDFTGGKRDQPSVQGLVVLCDDATGDMVSIMDARWITGARTAAASALVAREQARKGASVLAILGCGLQGRMHLPAIKAAVPGIRECRVFDVQPQAMAAYVTDLDGKHGVKVTAAGSVEELVRGADIVLTAGALPSGDRRPPIRAEFLARGSLTICIDFDANITDEAIAAMDLIMTDDAEQFEAKRRDLGIYKGVPRIDTDLGALLLHGKGRRRNDHERIAAFMLGLAIEDLAAAAEYYRVAKARSVGTWLPV